MSIYVYIYSHVHTHVRVQERYISQTLVVVGLLLLVRLAGLVPKNAGYWLIFLIQRKFFND